MSISIRRAEAGDEDTLAYIQTESWKAAFCHILDSDTLMRCTDLPRSTAMYRRLLEQGKGNGYLLSVDGTPHCIAWWDRARDADCCACAELICIHSLPDRWHRGDGSRMMKQVLDDIRKAGFEIVVLWVFRQNERARQFYEKHGFSPDGKEKAFGGVQEIRYQKQL